MFYQLMAEILNSGFIKGTSNILIRPCIFLAGKKAHGRLLPEHRLQRIPAFDHWTSTDEG